MALTQVLGGVLTDKILSTELVTQLKILMRIKINQIVFFVVVV